MKNEKNQTLIILGLSLGMISMIGFIVTQNTILMKRIDKELQEYKHKNNQ